MLALVTLLQLQATIITPSPDDSLPSVTLAEALRRATGLDPNYVTAIGQVENASWGRRSAFAVFILPSVTLSTGATQNTPAFFNFATLKPEKYSVQSQVTVSYDVFTGGQKIAELTRSAFIQAAAAIGATERP